MATAKQPGVSGETVTAIVIVHEGEQRLPRALRSIARQSWPIDELILVVKPGVDRSLEIARATSGAVVLRQAGTGIANARNLAIAAATSEYVAFLDHDDTWTSEKTAAQLRQLARTGADVCGGLIEFVADAGDDVAQPLRQQLERKIRKGHTPSALMMRRAIFSAVGPFDESLRIGTDTDWIVRSRSHAWTWIDDVVAQKQLHESNTSSDVEVNGREILRVAREHLHRRRGAN